MFLSCCIPPFPQGEGECDDRNNNGKGGKNENNAGLCRNLRHPPGQGLSGQKQNFSWAVLRAFLSSSQRSLSAGKNSGIKTSLHGHLLRGWPGEEATRVAEFPWDAFPGCCLRLEAAQPEAPPQTVGILDAENFKLPVPFSTFPGLQHQNSPLFPPRGIPGSLKQQMSPQQFHLPTAKIPPIPRHRGASGKTAQANHRHKTCWILPVFPPGMLPIPGCADPSTPAVGAKSQPCLEIKLPKKQKKDLTFNFTYAFRIK